VALLLVGGCLESDLVRCGDKLCPVGAFCTPEGCVLQDQIDVCSNKAEGDACQVLNLPPGFCRNGTCVSAVCGNGIMEPGEACDDANHDAGDGCSADCRSLESCGNDIIDLVHNEECDVGVPQLSGDGCTSTCKAEFDIWRDVTPQQLVSRWGARMVYDVAHNEIVLFGGFNGTPLGDTWVFRDGAWEQRTPSSSPEARYGHAMTYMPNVGVVMFGGTNGQGIYFNGTWVWDGTKWMKLTTANAPIDRAYSAMTYNPATSTIWLYGGQRGASVYNDTWRFDGTNWTNVTIDVSERPTGMDHAELFIDPDAPDPDFGKVWLVGGTDTAGKMYFWDGIGWTFEPLVVEIENVVPAYIEPSLGFDHGKVIMFGGKASDGTITNQTYRWDTDQWQWVHVTPISGSPTTRWRAAGATDGTSFMVFGGLNVSGTPLSGTYQLSTTTAPIKFVTLPTTPLPLGRYGAMASYDGRTGEVLIFGGFTQSLYEDADLWRWTFPLWRTGTYGPAGRMHGSMTYDEAREETVLFGGTDDCGTSSGSGSGSGSLCDGSGTGSGSGSGSGAVYYNDTTTLKDNAWHPKTLTTRPPARADAAIAYDPISQTVLLFGGQDATTVFNDTWQWNGTSWLPLSPATQPPGMEGARMVYDRARALFVLYGGMAANADASTLGRVWTYDGVDWREVTPAVQPPPRRRAVFVYNPRRQRVLLFGGVLPNGQILDDTWEWDGSGWEQRHPVQSPTPRYDASAVYDAAHGHVLLFGGEGQLGALQDDVWVYNFVSNNETPERCDGADADGDGLIDCADPDCYGYCDPYCPPTQHCAPTRPHCGDGVCAPIEQRGHCPLDCP
jgi:cysteine-rich repeat protein